MRSLSIIVLSVILILGSCNRHPCPTAGIDMSTGSGKAPMGQGEGMWPLGVLDQLDEEDLRQKGIQIPLTDLWSEGSGIAKASVKLMNGCSGSFVSSDGLIFTNHHCAIGIIQRNSTKEHNWIEEGFVAKNRGEELPGHGATIQVLRGFSDITKQVSKGLPTEMSKRGKALDRRESEIVAQCEEQPHTTCYVGRFLDGIPYDGEPDGRQRFTLFETTEIRDVRLVAAPPDSVGNYGDEIDNWHWPRHTGDYTILRAYVAPDGSSAEYDEANVPYQPDVHLQVSTEGVGPGDFVMVVGYPWNTTRYLTSSEIREQQQWYYPLRVNMFSQWSKILHEHADRENNVSIKIASHISRVDNGLSHAKGRVEAFKRTDLIGQRSEAEAKVQAWIAESPDRQKRFGDVFGQIQSIVEERAKTRDRDVIFRFMGYGSQVYGFARTITKWAAEQEKPNLDREPGYQDRDRDMIETELTNAQRSLDVGTDRDLFKMWIQRSLELPDTQRITAIDEALGDDRSEAAVDAFVQRIYDGTTLHNEEQRTALFGQDLETLRQSDDEMIRFALAMSPAIEESIESAEERTQRIAALRPLLTLALAESTSRRLYPDATSTPRISFGNVRGYQPRDGTLFTPFTTVAGLLAKDTGQYPFNSPEALLESAQSSQQSRWVDRPLGDVPICFLSDLDTTGGNSGSPVLDGQGRLVGLLFDGVWENLAGDIFYNPQVARSISVDIRYVLWLLEEVFEAPHIVEELNVNQE